MRRLFNILIKGVIPLFFLLWIVYFTGKSIREYIYYSLLQKKLERDILYLKARTAVREARINFLHTERGQKIFLKRMYEEISH